MSRKGQNSDYMKPFLIQSLIEIEEFMYKMPRTLELILLIIGQMQSTTFFLNLTQFNTFKDLPFLFSMICNPIYFLDDYSFKTFKQYSYLIVLFLILLFFFAQFLIFYREVLLKKMTVFDINCLSKYSVVVKGLCYYSAFFSQLLITVLIFPFSKLIQLSFEQAQENNETINYLHLVLCCVTLIMLLGIAVIKIVISLESTSIVPQGFNLIMLTNIEVFQFLIKIFQILVEVFNINSQFYLQSVACLFGSFLAIIELFFHYTQPDFKKVEATIFAQSYCLVVSLICIITKLIGNSYEQTTILQLLFHPLCFKAILMIWQEQRFLTLFRIQSNSHPKVQQVQLYLILTQFEGCYLDHQVARAMLIHQHYSECEDSLCFCRKRHVSTHVPKYAQILMPEHEIQLVLILSLNFLDSLRALKVTDQAIYYIHYISLINNLGYSSLAYQQVGVLLEGRKNVLKKKKLKQSQALIAIGMQQQNSKASISSYQSLDAGEGIGEQPVIQRVVLSSVNKIKIQILKQRSKNKIRQYIVIQNESQDELSDQVQKFMKNEEANDKLKQRILKIVTMKISFLKSINLREEGGRTIYDNTYRLIRKMMKLNDFIEQLYIQFPSLSIQSVYSFYSAEIMNDYLKAFNISTISTVNDDKVSRSANKMALNLFSTKLNYLVFTIDDSSYELKKIGASKQAHSFFGFSIDEFMKMSTPDFLIPACVRVVHNNLVKNFFNTGKSRYFRNSQGNISVTKCGSLKAIDFFYDLDFKKDYFIGQLFIQELLTETTHILLGMNNYISGIGENILNKLQYKDQQITQIYKIIQALHIKYLIPQWKDIVEFKFSSDQRDTLTKSTKKLGSLEFATEVNTFFNIDFVFISEKCLQNLISEQNNLKVLANEIVDVWRQKSNLMFYTANLIVTKRIMESKYFYIVEVDQIQLKDGLDKQYPTNIETRRDQDFSSFQDNYTKGKQEESQLDELGLLLKQFNVSQLNISDEQEPNQPKFIENVIHDANHQFPDSQDRFGVKMKQKQVGNQGPINISSSNDNLVFSQIASPKNNQNKPFIDFKSLSQSKNVQQRFFQEQEEISVQPSFENFQKSDDNNLNQFKINQDMAESDGANLNMKDSQEENNRQYDGSSVSSVAGLRNSRYFRKYNNVHQYIMSNCQSIYFDLFVSSIIFSLIISATFVLVQFATLSTDCDKFLSLLDTMSIQMRVMGPYDQQLLAATNIQMYNDLIAKNPDKKEYFENLSNFSKGALSTYLDLLIDDYRRQMESQEMSFLLQDNKLYNIHRVNKTHIAEYWLTLTSTLNLVMLRSRDLYHQLSVNYSLDLYKNLAYQFDLVNFRDLNAIFHYLRRQTVQLASQKVDQANEKQNLTFFILLSFSLFSCFIGLVFHLTHYLRMEEFLSLLQKLDRDHLRRDQHRFKIINKLLTRDIDVMFKYKFDLSDKERSIAALERGLERESKGRENQKNNNNNILRQSNFTLSKNSPFIYFIVSCCFFIAAGTFMHVQIQDYLQQYEVSTRIYSMISDKSTNIPEIFCLKQVAYNVYNPVFPAGAFPSHSEYENYILQDSLGEMDELVNFLGHLDLYYLIILVVFSYLQDSLSTQEFIDYFSYWNQNNLCEQFTDKQADISYFCKVPFQGALSRGLFQTVNSIRQSIKSEYELNKFTAPPADVPYGQHEAAILVLDLFQEINKEFKATVYSQTNNHLQIQYLVGSLFLGYIVFHVFFLNFYYYQVNLLEYQIIKKSFILLPSMSLIIDLQLERKLRQLFWQERN